jgi:hypothetical protein
MVDFVRKDVEPLEVIVHALPVLQGCLFFEPRILTPRKFIERFCPNLLQPAQVII